MKKLLLALLAVAGVGTVAHARDALDGCGLGWEVTDKKSYTGTTTRATTNWFIPPTFGMTTGTMGCEKLEIGKNDKEAADFVATNFENLKTDLAAGRGEYVDGLAGAFGCASSSAAVGAQLQKSYQTVVAPAATSVELFKAVRKEIAGVCI